jgi:DNA topoisomerase VI subunit B
VVLRSITMTALTPAIKHIVNNFQLYGFGSEESAIIQSAKEVIENSIDACKVKHSQTKDSCGAIKLHISSAGSGGGVYLDITDDGCGINSPSQVLKCFTTLKDGSGGSNNRTTGRFGVGLSTCLIHSLTKTAVPMRLITKCGGGTGATVADFSLNRSGEPACVQSRSVEHDGLLSGTKIRLALPLAPGSASCSLRRGENLQHACPAALMKPAA